MTPTTSDCGCGGSAGTPMPSYSTPASAPSTGSGMSATGPSGTVVLDGFHGLNPADGLFLRADHLSLIQDYARSLTTALATASAPGVVHGLGVRLTGNTLEVSPGLAISPRGRLLALATTVSIPLDADHLPAKASDGFWRVELLWAMGTSGSAPVYGSLCNDACSDGGASIRPWRDEGVEIRISPDTLPGLDAVAFAGRRNWLASAYFERERAGGQPWLVPTAAGNPVSLWAHDWEDATPLPPEAGVPLAVLQGTDQAYALDVWAARRLVDGSASNAAWRNRLAMRPWSIFLAQVLQFEAEISGITLDGTPKAAVDLSLAAYYQETTRDLLDETQLFLDAVKTSDPLRHRDSFVRLEKVVHERADNPLAAMQPLPLASQLGIGQLPPAGYLNVHNLPDAVEGDLRAFFGPNVDLLLRQVRADQVADEVMAAQHRDRIPLDPPTGLRPQVDVLVPVVPADLPALATDAYGWVAFIRRGPDCCTVATPPAPETEDVKVYLFWDSDPQRFLRQLNDEDLKRAMSNDLGTLTYPKGGWAYPGGTVAVKVLDALGGTQPLGLAALTRGADRPLASTRAGLFGTSLDSGTVLPVLAMGGQPVEAIVVIAPIVIN